MAPQVYHQSYHYVAHPPPPPPPVAHKVWILDCKSCGTFLTNRGMKAVLLLRPNVALYSSDAQPANCSPWAPEDEVRDRSGRRRSPPSPARTCECLTQTLCCHGCGNAVGYMIVVPCDRCTSSIANSNRSTNGHRFVFHSTEISGIERRYIPGEKGVKPIEPPPVVPQYWNGRPFEYGPPYPPSHDGSMSSSPHQGPSRPPGYIPPPSQSSTPPPRPLDHPRPGGRENATIFISPAQNHPNSQGVEYKEQPLPRRLQAGEYVFWHNLTKGGEILAVQNDERAKRPRTPESFIPFDR